MRGQFISMEGIDGAGKSSLVPWLADHLRQRGHRVVCTREPGGTALGEAIRAMVLQHSMDPETELMLLFSARREHLAQVIEPALARGDTVISDRFHDASYAFQGGGRNLPLDRIAELDKWVGGARPDLTFLFELPLAVARGRIDGARTLDRFESEASAFHARVRSVYLDRFEAEPSRIVLVDAEQTPDEIRTSMAAYLAKRFR